MDGSHEIFFNTDLWLAVNFLSQKETESLVSKIKPRIEMFTTKGTVTESDNIFDVVPLVTQEPELDAIQNMLQDENDSSDSESEESRFPPEKMDPNLDRLRKHILQDDDDPSDSESEESVEEESGQDVEEVEILDIESTQTEKKRKAEGLDSQKDAILGWLDSDDENSDEDSEENSEDDQSGQCKDLSVTVTRQTVMSAPKKSRLLNEGKKRVPENNVNENQDNLVNTVDNFIMSLQSQRKKV